MEWRRLLHLFYVSGHASIPVVVLYSDITGNSLHICFAIVATVSFLFSSVSSNIECISTPIAYNNNPTTQPGCFPDGSFLTCPCGALVFDGDTGSAELNTSKVFAWNREVNIVFFTSPTRVRQVNLVNYNIPSSGIGLPPAEIFWSDFNSVNPDIIFPLPHIIVGNQDLSQEDRTLRNVSLVVTTGQDGMFDYRYFRIHFTFPAETSLIDWILLSESTLWRSRYVCISVLQRVQHNYAPTCMLECQVYQRNRIISTTLVV